MGVRRTVITGSGPGLAPVFPPALAWASADTVSVSAWSAGTAASAMSAARAIRIVGATSMPENPSPETRKGEGKRPGRLEHAGPAGAGARARVGA